MATTSPGDPHPSDSTPLDLTAGTTEAVKATLFAPERARVAAAAIPGCQHILAAGLPCQDAVKAKLESDRVILAVSDGHGDPEYTFSDEGARTAVAVAVDVLGNLVDRLNDLPGSVDEATLESDLGDPVKRRIVFEWNRRVKNHAAMIA